MKIDQNKCVGCQNCKMNCCGNAIFINSEGKCEIDQNKCLHCGICASLCSMQAISE